ncbi:MAG: 4Fe-4S binding protein [Spirochaetaceae bacterium]|nr:4Fe-4S binding protein [Spirochaetaceae bacterium]
MSWLSSLIAFLAAFAAAFGGFFLAEAWTRKTRASSLAAALDAFLPGHDCGLCGARNCGEFAIALAAGKADPALCGPGGDAVESRIREILAEAGRLRESRAFRAIVRCGGETGKATHEFTYEGRPDCFSAARLYGGPKRCKSACLGLGTCAAVCRFGAISVSKGVARVSPDLCSGCGECVPACPTGAIVLIPRTQLWFVACSSQEERSRKKEICEKACVACGECARLSKFSEFSMIGELAAENPTGSSGGSEAEIARLCPTSSIVKVGAEKKRLSSFH